MRSFLKKILLVHPLGYNSDSAKKDISRMANIMPPLGLASISAYLEIKKIKSKTILIRKKPSLNKLKACDILFIGSSESNNLKNTLRKLSQIKARSSSTQPRSFV